jgi:uncharacterized protein with PQ loop repeat
LFSLSLSLNIFARAVIFVVAAGGLSMLLTWSFLTYPVVIEFIGLLSVTIEATLAVPQVLRNRKKQSTTGVSPVLVGSWFAGDFLKIVYFVVKQQPLQFILCGCVQVTLDCVLVWQAYTYSHKRHDEALKQ